VTQALLWAAAVLLMVVGLAGTVLPALPGIPLMFAGMVLGAWIDDFTRVGWVTLAVLAVLALLSIAVDFAASALGAKRVGASPRAIWGAALGTLAGLFLGVIGLIAGPFIGALLGELSVHGRMDMAGRVGLATWIGLLAGTAVKIALAFSMLGIFAFALLAA